MHLPPKSLTGSSSLHPSKYTPTSSTRICMTTLQSSPRISSHQNLSDDQVGKAQQTHTVSVHRNSYQPTSSSPNKIKYRTRQPLEITKTRPSLHPRSLPTVLQCKKPMYLLYHLSQILHCRMTTSTRLISYRFAKQTYRLSSSTGSMNTGSR